VKRTVSGAAVRLLMTLRTPRSQNKISYWQACLSKLSADIVSLSNQPRGRDAASPPYKAAAAA